MKNYYHPNWIINEFNWIMSHTWGICSLLFRPKGLQRRLLYISLSGRNLLNYIYVETIIGKYIYRREKEKNGLGEKPRRIHP